MTSTYTEFLQSNVLILWVLLNLEHWIQPIKESVVHMEKYGRISDDVCACVAGMLPHKTERGKAALRRLKTYEGCPPPYDSRRRLVVPGAMRVLCLKPGRKVILPLIFYPPPPI